MEEYKHYSRTRKQNHTQLPPLRFAVYFLFIKWFKHSCHIMKCFSNSSLAGEINNLITDDERKDEVKKKSHEVCLLFSSWYNEKKSKGKKNHSTNKTEMQLTELIMAQCKLASVFNINSWSDMFEAYVEPTVRYKSITSLTIRTIIYTIRAE